MAKTKPEAETAAPEAEVAEPLTPEQRIALLEKSLGTNRIILLVVALLLVVSLAASVAILFFGQTSTLDADDPVAPAEAALSLDQRQMAEKVDANLTRFDERLSRMELILQRTNTGRFADILLEQEKDKQQFALGAKEAITDLARMVPGSRTWLELYSEQIDKGVERSKARTSAISNIKTEAAEAAPEQ
ncbi:hypothetical protein [Allohahella marinimesophila]|uniref:Uncharacterized protein n=1 Tax=Allohahella marinimesophila TaxID=1054972 RepID=A0ABP7PUD6_9GAMM